MTTYAVKKKGKDLYWNKYKHDWVDLQQATTYIIKPTNVIIARGGKRKCEMVEVRVVLVEGPGDISDVYDWD